MRDPEESTVRIRRVIRRRGPTSPPAFDEQLWPVIIALFVLGGFVAGTLLTYLRFDDPRWYANVLTWLVLSILLTVGTALALAMIDNRVFRRGLQLAILLGLLFHALLFVASLELSVFTRSVAMQRSAAPPREPREVVTVPEYFQTLPRDQPRDFERPLQTEDPQPRPLPGEAEQEHADPEPTLVELQPAPVPEPVPTARPQQQRREQVQLTAPRFSEQSSQLSRSAERALAAPRATTVAPPALVPAAAPSPELASRSAELRRRETELLPEPAALAEQPASESPSPTPALARKLPQPSPKPVASAAPAFRRRVNRPLEVPRTAADLADTPATSQRVETAELRPQTTLADRQQPASPEAPSRLREPTPESRADAAAIELARAETEVGQLPVVDPTPRSTLAARRPPSAAEPAAAVPAQVSPVELEVELAADRDPVDPLAARSIESPRFPLPDRPDATEMELAEAPTQSALVPVPTSAGRTAVQGVESPEMASSLTAAALPRESLQARPAAATIADGSESIEAPLPGPQDLPRPSLARVIRQAATAVARESSQPNSPSPAASTALQIADASRFRSRAAVSIEPAAPLDAGVSRTATRAPVPASPRNVESPGIAVSQQGEVSPTAEPAKMTLARGAAGTAGRGQGPNLDRASPAGESPSLVVSASARRPHAMQELDAGPDLAPRNPATIPRLRAGEDRPQTTLQAEPTAAATAAAGVEAPDRLAANASAALVRSQSDAPPGPVTASSGSGEVDLGPTQVIPERSSGRASGGGQPKLNFETDAERLARRSEIGGAPQLAIAAETVATAPAAAERGGGRPVNPQTEQTATGVTRTDPGANEPLSGRPVGGLESDAATEVSLARRVSRTERSRSELADAEHGSPKPGGGRQEPMAALPRSPGRAASRAAPAAALAEQGPREADLLSGQPTPQQSARGDAEPVGPTSLELGRAETMQVVGERRSQGVEQGSRLAAQGIADARLSGGRRAPPDHAPVGVSPSDLVVDVPWIGEPGAAGGLRSASPAVADGPLSASLEQRGLPVPRSSATGLRRGIALAAAVELPRAGVPQPVLALEPVHPGITQLAMDVERGTAESGLAVNVDAIEGLGGLAAERDLDVGLNHRRALRESLQTELRNARFMRRQLGGLPDVSVAAVLAAEPYRRRMARGEGRGAGEGAGPVPPMTEEAIELGLAFLAAHQLQDGSWSLQALEAERPVLVSDTAATALSLLAFQGAAYTHRERKYADAVRAGLGFLLQNQRESGDLFVPQEEISNQSVWLYSHALATLAVCEAYGMTQDPWLREPAQKALDFIVASQHAEYGGWRYSPQYGSDTSVTGFMMTAMKSGELAGLNVPAESYEQIRRWLDRSQASGGQPYLYRYNPFAPDTPEQRHGREPTSSMTAVGLLMRLYLGWRRDDANMVQGANYLINHLPSLGSMRRPQRDTYYWYYATQVMFHMGGRYWAAWNERLHPLLIETQVRQGPLAGSWDPGSPLPDRWAAHAGRFYVTALNLLSLEVTYRHLPLYEETAR